MGQTIVLRAFAPDPTDHIQCLACHTVATVAVVHHHGSLLCRNALRNICSLGSEWKVRTLCAIYVHHGCPFRVILGTGRYGQSLPPQKWKSSQTVVWASLLTDDDNACRQKYHTG